MDVGEVESGKAGSRRGGRPTLTTEGKAFVLKGTEVQSISSYFSLLSRTVECIWRSREEESRRTKKAWHEDKFVECRAVP
jgi:hypothetical protein